MPPANNSSVTPLNNSPEAWGPTCFGCGCFCHDLVFENGQLVDDRNCCLARTWADSGEGRTGGITPPALNTSMWNASEELLRKAFQHRDLIAFTGLENLDYHAQDSAITLASMLNAWVLPGEGATSSDPWALAFAQKGAWLASWSEIRQRSDALLHWFAPTWETHPRWVERFGPRSHHAHRLAVVEPDTEVSGTGLIEEQLVRLEPAHALAFLADLRLALRRANIEPHDSRIRRLVHLFRQSHWLAILRGEDPSGLVDPLGVAESFLTMVGEANTAQHRVVVADLPSAINAAGLKALLSWKAGLAMPLWFSTEGPVYRPGEMQLSDFDGRIHFGAEMPDIKEGQWLVWLNSGEIHNQKTSLRNIIEIPVANHFENLSGQMVRGDGVYIRSPDIENTGLIRAETLFGHLCDFIVQLQLNSKAIQSGGEIQ